MHYVHINDRYNYICDCPFGWPHPPSPIQYVYVSWETSSTHRAPLFRLFSFYSELPSTMTIIILWRKRNWDRKRFFQSTIYSAHGLFFFNELVFSKYYLHSTKAHCDDQFTRIASFLLFCAGILFIFPHRFLSMLLIFLYEAWITTWEIVKEYQLPKD